MKFLPVFLIFFFNLHQVIFVKSEKQFFKYKTELHQIGSDVENFIFDVAKEVIKNANGFFNFDYGSFEDESNANENIRRNKISQENNVSEEVETTNEEKEKDNIDLINNEIEDTRKKRNTINYDETDEGRKRNKRLRTSIDGENSKIGETRRKRNTDNVLGSQKETDCFQNMEEVKEEIKRLYELLAILKDQQTILSLLDKDDKQPKVLPDQSDAKDLLKVLEHINNNVNEDKDIEKDIPSHKDLENLKEDLKEAISNLSQTKKVLKEEKDKESSLETALIQQQKQIDVLKDLVGKLISGDHQKIKEETSSKVVESEVKNDTEIVGAAMFIPDDLPTSKKSGIYKETNKLEDLNNLPVIPKDLSISPMKPENSKQVDKLKKSIDSNFITEKLPTAIKKPENNKDVDKDKKMENSPKTNTPNNVKAEHKPKMEARVSDLSELLEEIDKPKKNSLEMQIKQLEEKLEKMSREENMRKEILVLKKLLDQQKLNSRQLPDDDVDILRRLRGFAKLMDTDVDLEGKSDKGVDDELKKLENAINTLKPSGEVNLLDFSSQLHGQKGSVTLSVEQILELRKKLDDIINKEAKKGDKHGFGMNDLSENSDSKKTSLPYPTWYKGPYTPEVPPSILDCSYPQPNYGPYIPQGPFYKPYGMDYGPANFPPSPYFQMPTEDEIKNQFFHAPQPYSPFNRPLEGFNQNQEEFIGNLPHQPGINPSKDFNSVDTKIKNIDDLKMEINYLENILKNLNSQPYENYEEKATIDQLVREIEGLKNIINGLTNKANDSPKPGNFQFSNPGIPIIQNPPFPQPRQKRSISNFKNTYNVIPYQKSSVSDKLKSNLVKHKPTSIKIKQSQSDENVVIENIKTINDMLIEKVLKLYDELDTKLKKYLQGHNIKNNKINSEPVMKMYNELIPKLRQYLEEVNLLSTPVQVKHHYLQKYRIPEQIFDGFKEKLSEGTPKNPNYIFQEDKLSNTHLFKGHPVNWVDNMKEQQSKQAKHGYFQPTYNRPLDIRNKMPTKQQPQYHLQPRYKRFIENIKTINNLHPQDNLIKYDTLSPKFGENWTKDKSINPQNHQYLQTGYNKLPDSMKNIFLPPPVESIKNNNHPKANNWKLDIPAGTAEQKKDGYNHPEEERMAENSKNLLSEKKTSTLELYDDVSAKLRENLLEDDQKSTEADKSSRSAVYNDIRSRINNLKAQLGQATAREDGYYNPLDSFNDYNKKLLNNIKKPSITYNLATPPKKDDLFTDILLKILDKVIAALPRILGKLFGDSVQGLVDKVNYSGNSYGSNEYGVSYSKNDLTSVLYNLGTFGYIPLIILKIINAFSAFVNALKANKFFRNFLVPAFILMIVSGALIFLIWWFNGDNETNFREIGFENKEEISEKFDSYRNAYTGTNYHRNQINPMNYYYNPYYYYNYPNHNSEAFYNSRNVDNILMRRHPLYFRTYFDDGSVKN